MRQIVFSTLMPSEFEAQIKEAVNKALKFHVEKAVKASIEKASEKAVEKALQKNFKLLTSDSNGQ